VDSRKGLYSGRLRPYAQIVDKDRSGKRSSLLRCCNNYDRKKFYSGGPRLVRLTGKTREAILYFLGVNVEVN
jgi:hypothetical protein